MFHNRLSVFKWQSAVKKGIMCTIGGLGRHIGRQSTDISVDYTTMHQPICANLSVDYRPI